MFTGIIESLGRVQSIQEEGTNIHFEIDSDISKVLKIDQSLSHNGVCLTVVKIQNQESYTVTTIQETLTKTTMKELKVGDPVNLERALLVGGRFDGHIVQGHIDQIGQCISRKVVDGSWVFEFEYDKSLGNITIEKGSIAINGVSLTVIHSKENRFGVAVIPYTYEHTNFSTLNVGDTVNIEFDVLGKYISTYMKRLNSTNQAAFSSDDCSKGFPI